MNYDNLLNQCKVITADKEHAIFEELHKTHNKKRKRDLVNQIVIANARYAYKLTLKYSGNVFDDDMFQEALIALDNAIKTFNYKTKRRFVTYAHTQIVWRILNHIDKEKRKETDSIEDFKIQYPFSTPAPQHKDMDDIDNKNFVEYLFSKLTPEEADIVIAHKGYRCNRLTLKQYAINNNITYSIAEKRFRYAWRKLCIIAKYGSSI